MEYASVKIGDKKTTKKIYYREKLKPHEKVSLWISRLIIWAVIAIMMFPVAWVVGASMAPGDAFFSGSIFPQHMTFQNYKDVLVKTNFLLWVKNSMILSVGVAIIQLFLTATSAYAFSRMKFAGRKNGLKTLLILQMFPTFMALPAIFGIMAKLNLLDNLYALMLVMAGSSAFSIWLLKGYIDSLPKELDEAALVDGATHWQIFTKIILPLATPMLVVIFLFSFMGVYSEFILSSAVLKSPENYTIALGLQRFIQNQFSAHWTQFAAASVMASLPLVILFMVLQRYLQAGLAAGAVKG
ncbi:sugar ABC transporter permease [Thermoanaerobacter thermohydrosulfuricus]|uniref:ABC-type maltose transport system, permease component n=1 Tax=Thermoanaerobacter siderophilus SR4 TaxID=880478 RepID=I9ABS9_9THEO|nr:MULTISPECIES: sugar ABC transporter permease [Thermoanaerobacter]EIV99461.1 ABC-type maltose transport system, permease component [Thermoanaerobacter siderophilus SR4]